MLTLSGAPYLVVSCITSRFIQKTIQDLSHNFFTLLKDLSQRTSIHIGPAYS